MNTKDKNSMNEEYIKSLDHCQGIIQRMGGNSSSLKAWFLGIFTALFAYFARTETKSIMDLLWLLPMYTFIGLDAYYLRQERIFRMIYSDFAAAINDGDMNRKPFMMQPAEDQKKEFTLMNCIFSISVGGFYFPLLIAFQGIIIFYTLTGTGRFALMGIFPVIILILAPIWQKRTKHAKGMRF